MSDRPGSGSAAEIALSQDAARISAELVRLDGGTDPFAAAVRATRMPMIVTNPRETDNPVVFVNDSFCRLSGYAREEILGRNCRFLQGAETDPDTVRRIRDAVSNGRSIEIDIRNYRKNGETFWNRLLLAPVRDETGAIAYFFASQVDVTLERERLANLEGANAALIAEVADRTRALAASEERLRQLADNLREVLYVIDARVGLVEYVSPAYQEVWGRSARELLQDHESFLFGVHADDRSRVRAALRRQRAGEATEIRYRVQNTDGTERRIWDRAWPLRDESGDVYRVVGVAEDETARALAEERLAANEAQLRRVNAALRDLNEGLEARIAERTAERDVIWRTSTDLIVVCERDGTFRSVNPAWTDVLGYQAEELAGLRYDTLVHPDDLFLLRNAFAARSGENVPVRDVDIRLRHADGTYRFINWAATPQGGSFFAVGRDMTARRRLEEELRQSQKMEAVGQLTGGLAHDFNNLLTGITGGLELLQTRLAQGRAADATRYIIAAQDAAKRAASLTHRLLAFSRRQTLEPRTIDANRLVVGLEELIKRTVGPEIAVSTALSTGLWPVLVDGNQLENAILNLSINARDAMPDGGRLVIETHNRELDERGAAIRDMPPGQYVSLCVSDTGAGMSPEIIARAFEPFFTTKPLGQGTGLGLSMVYGFVRQSGGQVRIHSHVGEGTSVCLYLPRHTGSSSLQAEGSGDTKLIPGRGEQVLLVDDEPTVRMLISDVLEELGYRTLEADDGAAGLEILRSNKRIDLLVTDVGLPGGMNGRQLADAGRALRRDLKVLFITGYAETAVLGSGDLDSGMQILTKPFAMEELTRRLRDMLTAV